MSKLECNHLKKIIMLKTFTRYAFVGILNTLIHWVIFFLLYKTDQSQSLSNLIAFYFAVTFSFFVNAKLTFKAQATTTRYILYITFMGVVAFTTGMYADKSNLSPLVTLFIFSAISLICGFIYSKYVVFRYTK